MRKMRHRETKEGIKDGTGLWMKRVSVPGLSDSSAFAVNFFKLISYLAGAHVY